MKTGFALLAIISLHAAAAPASTQLTPTELNGPIEALKPGEYFWAPHIVPEGPVTIIVSLKQQKAYAYRNGVPIGVTTVSTGKPGKETPTGVFVILQKEIDHKSNKYNNAPMPFMQRLTWDGVAMHAGYLPGYPASHGCIRLPRAFAKLLFDITKLGLTVIITDDARVPEVLIAPPASIKSQPDSSQSTIDSIWQPEKSITGPISIVLSGRDRKIIVLRNGVLIGSSPVEIDGVVSATTAFTLRALDENGPHWSRLPLPGLPLDMAPELTAEERARVRMPEPFRAALAAILVPGTTLLVTRDSLKSGGVGKKMTVITTDAE
jgi:L,D-transpeptidase catalytic domain